MASKQISPAAQLLRHSKLFSLPAPLSKPVVDGNGATSRFESDSATQYYPTRAALITSNRGRVRGDWGLKRNLPLRKTARRANPIIQVKAVDNIDHITDYEPGTPYAIALRKFQEINVPINHRTFSKTKSISRMAGTNRSVFDVFEPTLSRNSTLEPSSTPLDAGLSAGLSRSSVGDAREVERWRFKGPWLAGLDEIEFHSYLDKQVKPQRIKFKAFLRSWMLRTKKDKVQSDKLAAGTIETASEVSLSEEEYEAWLVELRHEGKQLYSLMWAFLDLPGRPPSEQNDQSIGPPATHPSAGLSYLRTDNTLQNHPMLGAMLEHQPVPARILQNSAGGVGRRNDKGPAVGIAGFVSSETARRDLFAPRFMGDSGNDMRGERKIYVVPKGATIDERGRTNIQWTEADSNNVAVWEAEYNAKEQVKAEKEQNEIDGHMQKPARFDFLNI